MGTSLSSLSEIDTELAVARLGFQTPEYLDFTLFEVFSFPSVYEIYTGCWVGTLRAGSGIYSLPSGWNSGSYHQL